MSVGTDAEVLRLRAFVRDLVALSAIHAGWIGKEPDALTTELADALVGLLQLDFAFVRLRDPSGTGTVEVTRGDAWKSFPEWLESRLGASGRFPRKETVADVGGGPGPCRGLAIPIGPGGEGGVLAACCGRSDFPTETDQLLLSLGANQAATALQSAWLIHERRRAEEELREGRDQLELKVAERTAELQRSEASYAELAEEQAALRRVATLVARGVQPAEIFSAVGEEVGRLFGSGLAAVARFDAEGPACVVVGLAKSFDGVTIGSRWEFDDAMALAEVHRTGRSARVDGVEWTAVSGPVGAAARRLGTISTVASPIEVDDHLWGGIAVVSAKEPLPLHTEERLEKFTEIVATAIAKAESREALARLADEQAALRRVATMVARGASPEEVFVKVAEEVGRLLGVDSAAIQRYEPEGDVTVVGNWGKLGHAFRLGSRLTLDGNSVIALVSRTGRPVRVDSYQEASGSAVTRAREVGLLSGAGSPIVVDGRLWGVMGVATSRPEPLPPGAEFRVAEFTELVGAAISNVQALSEVQRLAEEQTALRHVATIVARESPPEDVFAKVAEEVGLLLGVEAAVIQRYESGGDATVVGSWGDAVPVGFRSKLDGDSATALVYRTERPARFDGYGQAPGSLAAHSRELGLRSGVASPIVVNGSLWGSIAAATSRPESLPADAESRIAKFTELVATAISNIQARSDLAASRARVVAASDKTRRQIERDLHDGAQQRLVHTVITLKLAQRALRQGEDGGSALVDEALEHAQQATVELRELVHGILPPVLTEGGLRAAVTALASRMPLPVKVDVARDRFPAAVEATAYFVAAEALTNVVKHAVASQAAVAAHVDDSALQIRVRDDGIGGARPDGRGFVGLADRLAVFDGQLRVESPADGGTLVAASIPLR